jgi:RND family efflux transporter MFP subunit
LVTVSRPVVRDVTTWDEYTGRLEAVDAVDVHARVSGYLETAPFPEGTIVKQGDVLFTIDVRPFQAQLDSAQGNVVQAEAKLQLSRDELTRIERAARNGAVSTDELNQAQQNVRQNEGLVTSAKAAAETARLNVEWCKVIAPIAGRIGRKLVTPGNLISGGGGAGPQPTLLTTITSVDPMYCYMDVDEAAVLRYKRQIAEHRRVRAREGTIGCYMALANEGQFTREGIINFVDNRIDPGSGTLRVRGVFPNADGFLTPGMFARIRVAGERIERAVLVADLAIQADQNNRYVLTVDDKGTVQYRPVTLGPQIEGYRVVLQGLGPEERVVVNGLMYARAGATVQAQDAAMPGGTPTAPAVAQGPANAPAPPAPPSSPSPPTAATTRPAAVSQENR